MTDFKEPGWGETTTRTARGVWTVRPTSSTQSQPEANTPATTAPTASAPSGADALPWRPAQHDTTGRQVRALARIAIKVVAGAIACWALAVAVLLFAYRWIAPPTSALMLAQTLTGTHITRIWRPLDAISPNLIRAVIMSEDAAYCSHRGVDFTELAKAYERGIEGGSNNGASTIPMQVTKNLFLWSSRSYVRKAIEIPLTMVGDPWWGKRRTLELYLNIAEWGPGIFGAEAAARAYFRKPASQLTENEAALMAVALPNPRLRNPARPMALQRRLASVVLGRMHSASRNTRCLALGATPDD